MTAMIEAGGDEATVRKSPRSATSRLGLAALRDAGAVVISAGRLFWRHWPALIALVFAGMAGRELIMVLAVKASALHGVLGLLVLVLAPIATLTALILMLRTLRPSLPWLSRATEPPPPPGVRRGVLDHLGSVLVPFLAVYASYGYLKHDVTEYAYKVFAAAAFGPGGALDGGKVDVAKRLPFNVSVATASVVVVAIVLRWLLGRLQHGGRRRWLGLFGAYVEVIWIVMVGGALTYMSTSFLDWVRGRRVVHWAEGTSLDAVRSLGPLAHSGERLLRWGGSLIGSVDAVILVPVAWLAVGAVVYGRRLAIAHEREAAKTGKASGTTWVQGRSGGPEQAPERESGARRGGVLRHTGQALGADVRGRFMPLIQGVRLLVRAGLRPMLLFCLVFLLVQTAAKWLWEAERLIIGPRDLASVWVPASGILSDVNAAFGQALLACLLAAAVDRVLATQDGDDPDASARTDPPTPTEPPVGGDGSGGRPPQPPRDTPSWNQPTVNLA